VFTLPFFCIRQKFVHLLLGSIFYHGVFMYFPDRESFRKLALSANLVPVYREILADMETPVSAFKKIDNGSVEGGEKWGRYSFLGRVLRVVKSGVDTLFSVVVMVFFFAVKRIPGKL